MSLKELLLLPSAPFATVYDDEGDAEAAAAAAAAAETAAAEKAAAEEKNKLAKVKLTPEQQSFVNSLLAEEKRRAQQKSEQLVTQLETEKNRVGTTAAEKVQLEERIESLRAEFATRDELKAREVNKKVKELEDDKRRLEADGATWKQRYDRDRKRIDLTQAAAEQKAFNPRQVVSELFDKSRLVEVTGEDGKATGEFETRVKLQTLDKEGKPVTLDLDPVGAVKQLKEIPEYANLFISPATGGLGGGNLGKSGSGGKAAHEMSTEEYMAARRKARREAAGSR